MAIPAVAAAVRKLRRLMIAAATLAGLLVLPWLPGVFELKEFWPYARARTDATSPERLQPLFSSSLRTAVSNLRRTRRYQILFVVWACVPMWRLPSEVRSRVREMWSERGPRLCSPTRAPFRALHSECWALPLDAEMREHCPTTPQAFGDASSYLAAHR